MINETSIATSDVAPPAFNAERRATELAILDALRQVVDPADAVPDPADAVPDVRPTS